MSFNLRFEPFHCRSVYNVKMPWAQRIKFGVWINCRTVISFGSTYKIGIKFGTWKVHESSTFELGLTKINSIRMQKIVVYRCLTSLRTKEIVIKPFSAGNVNSFIRIQIACSKEAKFYLVSKKITVNSKGVRTLGPKLRFLKLVRGKWFSDSGFAVQGDVEVRTGIAES